MKKLKQKRKKKINLDDKILYEIPSHAFYPDICPIRKRFVEEIDMKVKEKINKEFATWST